MNAETIYGISNEIPDKDLEEKVKQNFKELDIDITFMDTKDSYRLPLGKDATHTTKRVIAKVVNRKHSEAMPQWKK